MGKEEQIPEYQTSCDQDEIEDSSPIRISYSAAEYRFDNSGS